MPDISGYLQSKLNDQQYAAASYTSGHSLILAGAGSGKTRTLTYKIANLIYAKDVHPANILAVTFTNKAANEMKGRLQDIMADIQTHTRTADTSNDAAPDFDELISGTTTNSSLPTYRHRDYQWIGTFHSIFLKILKQDIEALDLQYTKQFSIYDGRDVAALIKTIIKQLDMKDRLERRTVQRTISSRKGKGRLPQQAGLHCDSQMEERALTIYQKYQQALEAANALDFDDLLLLPGRLFAEHPDVLAKRQQQFHYILVDEAQDTNTIQFNLMRQLTGSTGNITFIGDDYQSIYRWRGAVMQNFLNVEQRRPDIKTFKLETNYRSKPHIVEAGNHIIKQNNEQYDKEVTAHRQGDDMIRIFTFADEVDEAMQTIELITKVKEEQNKNRSDFTILYRTNAQSSPFEQLLLTEGIPYKVVGAFKFFERAEVKNIISYVKYLLNPQDSLTLKRIINTPSRKIGKTTIDTLETLASEKGTTLADVIGNIHQYAAGVSPAIQNKISSFNNLLQSMLHTMDMLTPKQLLEQIVQGIQYKHYLIKTDGQEKAEERMENIGQLINIAAKYEDTGRDAVIQFMDEISLMTNIEETGKDAPDAVMLMTIHGSKGLEFPYVFIVGLEEGVFPLPKAKFDEAELEEERRGMYVGITRAKDHLFLSYANSRQQRGQTKYNPPSRFLEELPDHLVKRYDMHASAKRSIGPEVHEGDRIHHKLFGPGEILELRDEIAIIKFDNPKFGLRKLETRFLETV